jgi:hypothetical protein
MEDEDLTELELELFGAPARATGRLPRAPAHTATTSRQCQPATTPTCLHSPRRPQTCWTCTTTAGCSWRRSWRRWRAAATWQRRWSRRCAACVRARGGGRRLGSAPAAPAAPRPHPTQPCARRRTWRGRWSGRARAPATAWTAPALGTSWRPWSPGPVRGGRAAAAQAGAARPRRRAGGRAPRPRRRAPRPPLLAAGGEFRDWAQLLVLSYSWPAVEPPSAATAPLPDSGRPRSPAAREAVKVRGALPGAAGRCRALTGADGRCWGPVWCWRCTSSQLRRRSGCCC